METASSRSSLSGKKSSSSGSAREILVIKRVNCGKGKFISEEMECEDLFKKTTKRGRDGRFIVSIPFKGTLSQLCDSKHTALNRLTS